MAEIEANKVADSASNNDPRVKSLKCGKEKSFRSRNVIMKKQFPKTAKDVVKFKNWKLSSTGVPVTLFKTRLPSKRSKIVVIDSTKYPGKHKRLKVFFDDELPPRKSSQLLPKPAIKQPIGPKRKHESVECINVKSSKPPSKRWTLADKKEARKIRMSLLKKNNTQDNLPLNLSSEDMHEMEYLFDENKVITNALILDKYSPLIDTNVRSSDLDFYVDTSKLFDSNDPVEYNDIDRKSMVKNDKPLNSNISAGNSPIKITESLSSDPCGVHTPNDFSKEEQLSDVDLDKIIINVPNLEAVSDTFSKLPPALKKRSSVFKNAPHSDLDSNATSDVVNHKSVECENSSSAFIIKKSYSSCNNVKLDEQSNDVEPSNSAEPSNNAGPSNNVKPSNNAEPSNNVEPSNNAEPSSNVASSIMYNKTISSGMTYKMCVDPKTLFNLDAADIDGNSKKNTFSFNFAPVSKQDVTNEIKTISEHCSSTHSLQQCPDPIINVPNSNFPFKNPDNYENTALKNSPPCARNMYFFHVNDPQLRPSILTHSFNGNCKADDVDSIKRLNEIRPRLTLAYKRKSVAAKKGRLLYK